MLEFIGTGSLKKIKVATKQIKSRTGHDFNIVHNASLSETYKNNPEELKKDIEQLRKLVNAQLARNERVSSTSRFSTIREGASRVAREDIKKIFKTKKNRYGGYIEATQEEIDLINQEHISKELKEKRIANKHFYENIALLNSMITFYNSDSYSQARLNELYKKRVDKFNNRYGTKFTWQQFQDMTRQQAFDVALVKYAQASAQLFEVIALFYKHGYKLVKALNDSYKKSQRVHKYTEYMAPEDIIGYISQRPVFDLAHLETVARTL